MAGSPTLALLKGAPKAPPITAEEAEATLGGPVTALATTAPAKPPKKPGKAKNDATKIKSVSGEVLGPDLLATTAHEIENLDEAKANAMVGDLTNFSDFNNFKLGGVLSKIFTEKWFAGYPDMKAYVEGVHGFKMRKAFYLMGNYNGLIDLGITWDVLQPVGWSKLKELVGGDVPVINKDNAQEWLALASAEDMTVMKLAELVKKAKGEGQPLIEGSTDSLPLVKKNFLLHTDQLEQVQMAIDKAKAISGTESDAVALDNIAMDFLASAGVVKAAATEIEDGTPAKNMTNAAAKKWMVSVGIDMVIETMGLAFPDVNMEISVEDGATPTTV